MVSNMGTPTTQGVKHALYPPPGLRGSVSIYISIQTIYISIYLYIFLSLSLSVSLYISIFLSIYLSISLPLLLSLSFYSTYLPIYLCSLPFLYAIVAINSGFLAIRVISNEIPRGK
jgi:hypothetical protein